MESDVLATCWFCLFRFDYLLLVALLLLYFAPYSFFSPLTLGVGWCAFQFLENAVDFSFPPFSWRSSWASLNRGGDFVFFFFF